MAARKNAKKTQATQAAAQVVKKAATPVYAPVSTELTAYGTRGYRTPTRANQFTGTQGSPQEAVVLDIDGTMQGWGGGLDSTVEKWCAKHYKRNSDIVFLVVTARDHEYMYETSFNWIMRDFPYAFIGPFCRALDDPRLASEFKYQLAAMFEDNGVYKIVGAADDNSYVNKMWEHWKATRNPAFDLLECDAYGDYGVWRSGLSSKGGSWGSVATPVKATTTTGYVGNGVKEITSPKAVTRVMGTKQTWVVGAWDADQQAWVKAHWENEDDSTPTQELTMGEYLASRPGPDPLPSRADLEDQAHHANPHWTPEYVAKLPDVDLREAAGITNGDYRRMLYDQIANLFGSHCCDAELDWLDLEEIEPMLDMTREEIEAVLDRYADEAQTTVSPDAEERTRREQRMDLEDLARKVDPSLSLKDVEAMDSVDLHNHVAELLASGVVVPLDETQQGVAV